MSEAEIDKALVQRVQRGDKQAFNALVIKYQFKVMKIVGRYVHDPHEMMDVAQEVFIKAYRALANFRGESAFYTWLYRISVNTAKNYLISQDRRPPDSDIDPAEAENYEGQSGLKEYATPLHEVLTEEIESTVYEAIDALPNELKSAILLREIEGLTYEEIADVMECPIGTVRSRIFRARESIDKQIRPLLKDY